MTRKHVASPAISLVRKTGKRGLSPQVHSFSEWKKKNKIQGQKKATSLSVYRLSVP